LRLPIGLVISSYNRRTPKDMAALWRHFPSTLQSLSEQVTKQIRQLLLCRKAVACTILTSILNNNNILCKGYNSAIKHTNNIYTLTILATSHDELG